MVRRWHCHSCPWRFCLVTDTHDLHGPPIGCPGAALVPGRMTPACSKHPMPFSQCWDAPEPVLLGGQQERSVEEL